MIGITGRQNCRYMKWTEARKEEWSQLGSRVWMTILCKTYFYVERRVSDNLFSFLFYQSDIMFLGNFIPVVKRVLGNRYDRLCREFLLPPRKNTARANVLCSTIFSLYFWHSINRTTFPASYKFLLIFFPQVSRINHVGY